uniref:Uncharacterized protein n=1 Tax=Glycine max TaxID=3847 RepID=A0A0R0GAF4_SOYBN
MLFINMYNHTGDLPSKNFQGNAAENSISTFSLLTPLQLFTICCSSSNQTCSHWKFFCQQKEHRMSQSSKV